MALPFIVTNFAHGNGPFLRTTELALALNAELERRGRKRLGILVPWVYGERQRRIMREQFASENAARPGEIVLDKKLGQILNSVFYEGGSFEAAVKTWIDRVDAAGEKARAHLKAEISAEDLDGNQVELNGKQIALELQRSPRVRYGVAPAYCVTFAHFDDILRAALNEPAGTFAIDPSVIKEALKKAETIEAGTHLHCVSVPDLCDKISRDGETVDIPPTVSVPPGNEEVSQEGIYVTVTGIAGLDRLYRESSRWNLKIYTNEPEKVAGGAKATPAALKSPKIRFHFGRSGWGSVWLSQLTETPFVAAAYDPSDDPEIHFNNRWLERAGIGSVDRGEPMDAILGRENAARENVRRINRSLRERFGTLDGNLVAARHIGNRFLKGELHGTSHR